MSITSFSRWMARAALGSQRPNLMMAGRATETTFYFRVVATKSAPGSVVADSELPIIILRGGKDEARPYGVVPAREGRPSRA